MVLRVSALSSWSKWQSQYAREIQQPVPGYPTLAVNVMARIWNNIPELESASSVGAAMSISRKWARTIPR